MSLASILHPGPRAAPPEELRCGDYLTDGQRLFRVLSPFSTVREHVLARLENCLTLEVRNYSPDERCAMKLRPVQVAK
jgi:hypothetical protein